jgi:hypothetical protein
MSTRMHQHSMVEIWHTVLDKYRYGLFQGPIIEVRVRGSIIFTKKMALVRASHS